MKHVPIGTIKQRKGLFNDTLSYSVSLFKGRIRKRFNSLNEAKTFAEVHVRSMLAENEVTALCVRYKRLDGFSSYLMYDFLWNENTEDAHVANEYEETEFEYLDGHTWYYPHWKKAKKVDERSYCAGDILRAAIARSPLVNYFVVLASIVMFFALLMGLVEVFYIFNEYLISSRWYVNLLLVLALASMVIGLIFMIKPYIKLAKIIKRHERDFNEVDWKEVFKENRKQAALTSVAILSTLVTTLTLLLVSHFEVFSDFSKESLVKKILVGSVIVHSSRLFVLLATRLFIYYKISKLVKHLFATSEWNQFKKWLKTTDPIWEFRTSADFFIIPHEYSFEFVKKEKILVDSLIKVSDTDEIKNYANKAIKHYKTAVKKHFAILRGDYVDIQ